MNADQKTAAKIEALGNADAHLNNAGLPTASEMILALRKTHECASGRPTSVEAWREAFTLVAGIVGAWK